MHIAAGMNEDYGALPAPIRFFLLGVFEEISGHDPLSRSQLATLISHSYPSKTPCEIDSMIDDVIQYCGLKEPFDVQTLIANYDIAWKEDKDVLMIEIKNLGKQYEFLFAKFIKPLIGPEDLDEKGDCIHILSKEGTLDCVRFLYENASDLSTPMNDGTTPVYLPSQEGNLDCLRFLYANGAGLLTPEKNGATPVHIPSQEGNLDCLRFLYENDADLLTPKKNGATSVYIPSKEGKLDCLRFLYAIGADLSTPMNDGITPVYIPSKEGNLDCLRFLYENGADLLTPEKNEATPVYISTKEGKLDCLRFLY